jgi:uncharacterized protein YndB with AHSA1/START domain
MQISEKKMKKKFELEYPIRTSPKFIFPRLSTPGGLSEWFADDVTVRGNIYTFMWDGVAQKAELKYIKDNSVVRFEWVDEENIYFEFKLKSDELTGELAIMITDFVEDDEKLDSIELWDTQFAKLKQTLGL